MACLRQLRCLEKDRLPFDNPIFIPPGFTFALARSAAKARVYSGASLRFTLERIPRPPSTYCEAGTSRFQKARKCPSQATHITISRHVAVNMQSGPGIGFLRWGYTAFEAQYGRNVSLPPSCHSVSMAYTSMNRYARPGALCALQACVMRCGTRAFFACEIHKGVRVASH